MTVALSTAAELEAALLFRGEEQAELFAQARECRTRAFARQVESRSVIEYANLCRQACNFCGIAHYTDIRRYVMPDSQFLELVDELYASGRRVVMVQTGETDGERYVGNLSKLLARVKKKYPALILVGSFGSLSDAHYEGLREIGVERYLLKFETSDPALYSRIKPSDDLSARLGRIETLKRLGFKVSSGNITGLPGQSLSSLVADLLLLRELRLPMVSTSPFIPHELTPFAGAPPADLDLTLNFLASLRILCPEALIPTVSALELLGAGGQAKGLMAGANAVTLHDGTPGREADKFVIYRKDRYKPTTALLEAVAGAGLELSKDPLL
jgi:biotin synthase